MEQRQEARRVPIVRPWTASKLMAVFHSECESGEGAPLSVRLDPDGTIAYASLVRSATIYHGPAVWLPRVAGAG
jgi:hypothetical protein